MVIEAIIRPAMWVIGAGQECNHRLLEQWEELAKLGGQEEYKNQDYGGSSRTR